MDCNRLVFAFLVAFLRILELHGTVLEYSPDLCGYNASGYYDPTSTGSLPDPVPVTDDSKQVIEARLSIIANNFLKGKRPANYESKFNRQWGNFSDVDYTHYLWPRNHCNRLGGFIYRDYKDSALLPDLIKALEYMLTVNNPSLPYDSSREWGNLIANPLECWPSFFWIRKNITNTLMTDLLDKIWRDTDNGDVWNMTCRNDKNAGGNFGPRAIEALADAFLRDDLDIFVQQLKVRMEEEVVDRRAFMNDSFRHDGCIHQHNPLIPVHHQQGTGILILNQNYMTNYGKEFLLHLSSVLWTLNATGYDLGTEIKEAMFDSFFECMTWLFRGKLVDPSALGRFVDDGRRMTYYGPRDGVQMTLEYLKEIDHRNDEVESALHRYYNVIPDDEHALIGNKHFFLSDLMAHHRKQFMVTLRLSSLRCNRPETKPGRNENKYGYFLGDGFMTLVLDTGEMGVRDNELFQAFRWARIPGVTSPDYLPEDVPAIETDPPKLLHMYNNHSYVGGVSDTIFGMAAMVLARPPVDLRAKKSFLMLDKVILAMGSDIKTLATFDSSLNVITTMGQVVFDGSYSGGRGTSTQTITATEVDDREWSSDLYTETNSFVHHREVAYISLQSHGKLMSSAKSQTHKKTNDIFTTWINHGSGSAVNGLTYSYLVYPKISLADTITYAQSPDVEVMALTADKHDACDHSKKLEGVALFESGCFSVKTCLDLSLTSAEVCTDEPALVLAKMTTDGSNCDTSNTIGSPSDPSILRVTIADPTHKLSTITVTFKKDGTSYPVVVTLPSPSGFKPGTSTNLCYFY